MQILILAAGEGTRMQPLTANKPKPLIHVAGKPFLQHTLETLKGAGCTDIKLLIGWRDARIREYFGNGSDFGVEIEYISQKERLGTAHAVGMAKNHMSGDFLCLNGDVLIEKNSIESVLEAYRAHGETVMGLAEVSNPSNFGVITLDSPDGSKVISIDEKPERPKSNLVNAGLYVFKKDIFELIDKTEKSKRGEYEITDTLAMVMDSGKLYGSVLSDWFEIGKPWDILGANERLMEGLKEIIEGTVEPNATIKGPVQVGEGTTVRNGAYIVGPVIIGKNCDIGPNCFIRPSTSIGNGCKVGNAVEIKNSILMDNSNVPHHNYVGDSIIGEGCNLGSGTKIANLRLDGKNIKAILRGKLQDTGRRKLGAIIGDNVKTGINATIDSGTIIGESAFIGPGARAFGAIKPKTRVF